MFNIMFENRFAIRLVNIDSSRPWYRLETPIILPTRSTLLLSLHSDYDRVSKTASQFGRFTLPRSSFGSDLRFDLGRSVAFIVRALPRNLPRRCVVEYLTWFEKILKFCDNSCQGTKIFFSNNSLKPKLKLLRTVNSPQVVFIQNIWHAKYRKNHSI